MAYYLLSDQRKPSRFHSLLDLLWSPKQPILTLVYEGIYNKLSIDQLPNQIEYKKATYLVRFSHKPSIEDPYYVPGSAQVMKDIIIEPIGLEELPVCSKCQNLQLHCILVQC